MSRSMVQVPDELKSKLEDYKLKLRKKTVYEVIEYLMVQHERFDEYKEHSRLKEEQRQQHIYAEYVHLGADCKARFEDFKQLMNLHRNDAVYDLLQEHWDSALEINQAIMMSYITDYSKRK